MDQPEGPGGPLGLSDEDLNVVLSNTAAVLGPVAGKKDEWRKTIRENTQRAREEGHAEIAVFLGALGRLIDEGVESLDEIGDTVPDAYTPAWEALSAHLRGEPVRGLTKEDINTVLTNSIAVLLEQPEMLEEWRGQMIDAIGQAEQVEDHESAAFLGAMVRLLDEGADAVDDITPTIPDIYLNPWEALRRYLEEH